MVVIDPNYQNYPCLCGHSESRHRRVLGTCRGKDCDCTEFMNLNYIVWRQNVLLEETLAVHAALQRCKSRVDLLERKVRAS